MERAAHRVAWVALRTVSATAAFLCLVSLEAWQDVEPTAPVAGSRATLYAVGDIMYRTTSEGAAAVGQLLERLLASDPVANRAIVAGDVCNDEGAPECYERLDETRWGPLRPLLYPVPGNHDYQHARGTGGIPYYFNYMLNAGNRERGWYAFDWGGWRVVALNSEAMIRDEQHRLSAVGLEQMRWLDEELRQYARDQCVLTYYHRPMYSSGRFPSPAWVGPLFRRSYKYGVDLYFAGHEHMFAALPALTPFRDSRGVGIVDRAYGIPGLIGGTGGAVLFPDPRSDPMIPREQRGLKWGADGEVVLANTWGITRIDLWPGAYHWTFIPVQPEAGRLYPSGGGWCHDNPPRYDELQE